MQLLFLADAGSTIHAFKSPEACVNHVFRVFADAGKGPHTEKQLFSNSDGLHMITVKSFDKKKVTDFIKQMHLHASFIVVLRNRELDTEERYTIRKSYLM